ncbi:MAG: hypothetical protein CMJ87_01135 [Planctomycetes bacterium]|nr:hypothetical protein [Planctomycetota bacterium]
MRDGPAPDAFCGRSPGRRSPRFLRELPGQDQRCHGGFRRRPLGQRPGPVRRSGNHGLALSARGRNGDRGPGQGGLGRRPQGVGRGGGGGGGG